MELYFSKDPQKTFIDAMMKYQNEIKTAFNGEIVLERIENKKASRIKHEMRREDVAKLEGRFNDENYWPELIEWYRKEMTHFYTTIYPYWEKVQKELT